MDTQLHARTCAVKLAIASASSRLSASRIPHLPSSYLPPSPSGRRRRTAQPVRPLPAAALMLGERHHDRCAEMSIPRCRISRCNARRCRASPDDAPGRGRGRLMRRLGPSAPRRSMPSICWLDCLSGPYASADNDRRWALHSVRNRFVSRRDCRCRCRTGPGEIHGYSAQRSRGTYAHVSTVIGISMSYSSTSLTSRSHGVIL